jgi:hypothetical protein
MMFFSVIDLLFSEQRMGRAASVGDESGYDTTWGHVRIGVGFAHSPRRRPKEVAGKMQIL